MPAMTRFTDSDALPGVAPLGHQVYPLDANLDANFSDQGARCRTLSENPAHMTGMDQNQPTDQRIRDILTELGQAITDLTAREEEPPRINPRLLTVEEAGAYLNISRSSVYKLINDDDLPTVTIIGKTRVDRDQLDEWISSRARRAS